MHCFVKGLADTILGVASTVYLLLGLIIIAGGLASFVTPQGKAIVPGIYAAGGLVVGFLVFLLAIAGYAAICAKKWYRCFLGTFMAFDLVILVACVAIAAVMFSFEQSMDLAAKANVNGVVTAADSAAMKAVKDMVISTLNACDGTAVPRQGVASRFTFSCSAAGFSFIGTAVNMCLTASPLDTTGSTSAAGVATGSPYYQCYEGKDQQARAAWVPKFPITPPAPAVGSPKGVFCQCSSALMDQLKPYMDYIKWVGIAIVVFFGLVFLSCCYLMCCAKRAPKEQPMGGGGVQFTNVGSQGLAQP